MSGLEYCRGNKTKALSNSHLQLAPSTAAWFSSASTVLLLCLCCAKAVGAHRLLQWVRSSFLQAPFLQGLFSVAALPHLLPIASAVCTKQLVIAGGNGVGSLILLLALNCCFFLDVGNLFCSLYMVTFINKRWFQEYKDCSALSYSAQSS